MNAVVIPFPFGRRDRARPATQPPALSPEDRFTILSRARSICIGKQLSGVHKAVVLQCVDHWLDLHISGEEVLRRAKAKAEQLKGAPTPPEAA